MELNFSLSCNSHFLECPTWGEVIIADVDQSRLVVLDAESGATISSLSPEYELLYGLSVHPSEALISVAGENVSRPSENSRLQVLNIWNGAVDRQFAVQGSDTQVVRFSPDGQVLGHCGSERGCDFIDLNSESEVGFAGGEEVHFDLLFPDNENVIVACLNACAELRICNLKSDAVSPQEFVEEGWYEWEARRRQNWMMLPELRRITGVTLSPEGQVLAVSHGGMDFYKFPREKSGTTLTDMERKTPANARATVTTRARWLSEEIVAWGDEEGAITFYDLNKEQEIHRFAAHLGAVGDLCFSRNRKSLVSCGGGEIGSWKLDWSLLGRR